MIDKRDRIQILLSDVDDDMKLSSSLCISSVETAAVNKCFDNHYPESLTVADSVVNEIPVAHYDIASVLSVVSPLLCPRMLCSCLTS